VTSLLGLNMVSNASFEVDATGWAPVAGSEMARVPGGFDGGYSLEMRHSGSGTARFAVASQPVVSSAAPGTVYRFGAWVKSDSSRGRVWLRIRETGGGTPRSWVESPAVTLSPSWQKMALQYASREMGSTLEMQIATEPVRKGESSHVDMVEVRAVSTATQGRPATIIDLGPGSGDGDQPAARVIPNPVQAEGRLTFSISRPGPVSVRIFDPGGRLVRNLVDEDMAETGSHVVPLDGRADDGEPLRGGVYFYQIRSADGPRVGRFAILR